MSGALDEVVVDEVAAVETGDERESGGGRDGEPAVVVIGEDGVGFGVA